MGFHQTQKLFSTCVLSLQSAFWPNSSGISYDSPLSLEPQMCVMWRLFPVYEQADFIPPRGVNTYEISTFYFFFVINFSNDFDYIDSKQSITPGVLMSQNGVCFIFNVLFVCVLQDSL